MPKKTPESDFRAELGRLYRQGDQLESVEDLPPHQRRFAAALGHNNNLHADAQQLILAVEMAAVAAARQRKGA